MATINKVRVAQADGSFGPEIDIGVYAKNVLMQTGENIEDYLNTHSGGGGDVDFPVIEITLDDIDENTSPPQVMKNGTLCLLTKEWSTKVSNLLTEKNKEVSIIFIKCLGEVYNKLGLSAANIISITGVNGDNRYFLALYVHKSNSDIEDMFKNFILVNNGYSYWGLGVSDNDTVGISMTRIMSALDPAVKSQSKEEAITQSQQAPYQICYWIDSQ